MFTKKKTPATSTRPKIDPNAKTLHISEVTDLFGIKPGTLRQYVSRGSMPAPTVRRSPELGWDTRDIYVWAYKQGLMPLAAVPFRHLRHVIDHTETRGAPVPRVHGVEGITQGQTRRDTGIKVQYGGLTEEKAGFTLYFAADGGAYRPAPGETGIVAKVRGEVHRRGFYVDVFQAHPDFDYEVDRDVSTRDVAALVGEAIPYWPYALRSVSPGIDRATGRISVTENARAHPEWFAIARDQAVEAFASSPQGQEHPDLVTAMRADVRSDYREAAEQTALVVETYVSRWEAKTWTLGEEEKRHLVLAATLAPMPPESSRDEQAREALPRLEWTVPVGDSPAARQVARERQQRQFLVEGETESQRAFRSALIPVAPDAATLTHLSFTHPKYGTPSAAMTVPCEYFRDHYSGALVTVFAKTEDSPEYCCYDVPRDLPEGLEAEAFDFTDERNPFMLAANGVVVPFPSHPHSDYTLGYTGTGPLSTMETTARLLGDVQAVHPVDAPDTWPWYQPGYPTHVSAEEMRARMEAAR